MQAVDVRDGSAVAEARRAAVTLAQTNGFGEGDAGRVAIVATELSTNLLKHGGGGTLLVGHYDDETGQGIECLSLDKGPGMADVSASMRDGHSTVGSPGTGLGAVVRGAQATDIYSVPGGGTAILARMAARPLVAGGAVPRRGVVAVPMPGEVVCGDDWQWAPGESGFSVIVADGLGHGPHAAEASQAATRIFAEAPERQPSAMLAALHAALRPTRGAAVSIAQVDLAEGVVRFAGVGNVAAMIVDRTGAVQRLVCNNGTIGHIARHMRDFTYRAGPGALLVLASDGLGTGWRLDAYPGLMERHPSLIAGVLYRDFTRGRDDVTVLVCRL